MKIIVSAYACEPYKGSEPGIGWHFVNQMSKYHEVHVITRANNRSVIEADIGIEKKSNLIFHYYDIPKTISFWKKGKRGYQFYYYLWQIFVFFKFKKLINNGSFDIVHHLTFGANWMPSLLMLTKPFSIWGPVGSEDIYKPIIKTLPFKTRLKEVVRSAVKFFFYYIDPVRWISLLNADLILNHSSKHASYRYPKWCQKKVRDHIQTGLNTSEPEYRNIKSLKESSSSVTRLIIASELVAWKGVVLSSEVFAEIASKRNDVELIVLGEGEEKSAMESVFSAYKVEGKVFFKGFVDKQTLMNELHDADILLYPAYHHGLATIILQSMYSFLPIITMDGDIISDVVHDKCGLSASGNSIKEIKKVLIANTQSLIDDRELRKKLAITGREMVNNTYEWEQLILQMQSVYKQVESEFIN